MSKLKKCINLAVKRGGIDKEELLDYYAKAHAEEIQARQGFDDKLTEAQKEEAVTKILTDLADENINAYTEELNKVNAKIAEIPVAQEAIKERQKQEEKDLAEQEAALIAEAKEKPKTKLEQAKELRKVNEAKVTKEPVKRTVPKKDKNLTLSQKEALDDSITEAVQEQEKGRDGNKTGFAPKPYKPTKADKQFAEETPYLKELSELDREQVDEKDIDPRSVQKLNYGGSKEYKEVWTPATSTKESKAVQLSPKERLVNEQIQEAAKSDNKQTSPMAVFTQASKTEELVDDTKTAIRGIMKRKNIPGKSIPKLFDTKLKALLDSMFADTGTEKAYIKEFGEHVESWEEGFRDPNGKKITPDEYKQLLYEGALEAFEKDPYIRLSEKELQKKIKSSRRNWVI